MDELVVRVVLKKGANRDAIAEGISAAVGQLAAVDLVTVDLNESGPVETTTTGMPGGLQLEQTRRLYVRFGPRPDERLVLATQQFSMLGMLMMWPTVRGSKRLLERLREWDQANGLECWAESTEGSATRIYSRLAESLDTLAKRRGVHESGLWRLTRRRGVYGWLAVLPEGRK